MKRILVKRTIGMALAAVVLLITRKRMNMEN